MARRPFLPLELSLAVLILLHSLEGVLADSVPYLIPGFEFSYNQPVNVPVTNQCDTIHISWQRTSKETGPSPVAPYTMQVYSSASSLPYIVDAGYGPKFDWTVPFAGNTQYQTCMFDATGVSGGCQEMYTVLPSNATCQQPTAPTAMKVSAVVSNSLMTQNSQINQCGTLSVTPQSGSGPFTLTVAPESHPPYNISSQSRRTLTWQASLPVGTKFFLLLSSSDGEVWANGPMSVGGQGTDSCFLPGMISTSVFGKVAAGAGIGGLIVGAACGLLGVYIFNRIKGKRRAPSQLFGGSRDYSASDSLSQRPLKGPESTINRTTSFGALSNAYSEGSQTRNSIPLTQPLVPVRHSSVMPPVPPMPVTPPPPSQRARSRSREPYTRVPTESTPPPTVNEYPADIKHPIPPTPSDASFFSRDDTESLASSSNTHSRASTRPLSVHSRAPTYVPRSSHLRGAVPTIEESDTPEMPPEYGRHTADPHLKYAPSVLSSGNRF